MLIFNVNAPIGGDVLMDEYSLFIVALGLERPWEIADIKTANNHLGHKSLLTTVAFYGNLGAEDWLKKSAENIKTRLFI